MQKFENKVAVVTGAGAGIGRETALLFSKLGASVVVNDFGTTIAGEGSSPAPADETTKMILDAGGKAVASFENVATWQAAQRIIETALDHFGRIDIVVNNAGNVRWAPFWEIEPDEYHSILDTHLDGTFFVSRAAAPHFKAQQSGAFVHMTSASGLMGFYNQAPYCAAKAGIVGLSRGIALDMKAFGVRSNCVAPFAYSRMAAQVPLPPELVEKFSKMKPAQNAQLAVALAADEAADINGQVFVVRGNEIFLAGQGFPTKSMHNSEEWNPDTILSHALPALRVGFTPEIGFQEYFSWDIM